jgi:hypothetical protein
MKQSHLVAIANDESCPVLSYNTFLCLLDHSISNQTAPTSLKLRQRFLEPLQLLRKPL